MGMRSPTSSDLMMQWPCRSLMVPFFAGKRWLQFFRYNARAQINGELDVIRVDRIRSVLKRRPGKRLAYLCQCQVGDQASRSGRGGRAQDMRRWPRRSSVTTSAVPTCRLRGSN
jgi:hypothetical protein